MAVYGLDWAGRKLQISRKNMFYLLYYTESMVKKKQLLFNYINKLFY